MKKTTITFLALFILLLTGCSQADIVGIPKGYIEKQEFYDKKGFQDYTDYAKYKYSDNKQFVDNNEYQKVTDSDIDNIRGYFDHFKGMMESLGRADEYDFNDGIINAGDYVKIKTKEGESMGDPYFEKYADYDVYFFDVETNTLYYIHSNI